MTQDVISSPLEVAVVEGEVVVLGPDGLSGSFTPEAAEASAGVLLAAAVRARTEPRREPSP